MKEFRIVILLTTVQVAGAEASVASIKSETELDLQSKTTVKSELTTIGLSMITVMNKKMATSVTIQSMLQCAMTIHIVERFTSY